MHFSLQDNGEVLCVTWHVLQTKITFSGILQYNVVSVCCQILQQLLKNFMALQEFLRLQKFV